MRCSTGVVEGGLLPRARVSGREYTFDGMREVREVVARGIARLVEAAVVYADAGCGRVGPAIAKR